MRSLLATAILFAGAGLAAQTTTNDIGLVIDSGGLNVLYGQFCGPVTCQPMPGPVVVRGTTRNLNHNAAANTPFGIAVGLPAPCSTVAGIANMLLLGPPVEVIALGVTGPPVPTAAGFCPRGVANVAVTVPLTAPPGVTFVVQSLGVDWSGALGLSNGIAVTVQ